MNLSTILAWVAVFLAVLAGLTVYLEWTEDALRPVGLLAFSVAFLAASTAVSGGFTRR